MPHLPPFWGVLRRKGAIFGAIVQFRRDFRGLGAISGVFATPRRKSDARRARIGLAMSDSGPKPDCPRIPGPIRVPQSRLRFRFGSEIPITVNVGRPRVRFGSQVLIMGGMRVGSGSGKPITVTAKPIPGPIRVPQSRLRFRFGSAKPIAVNAGRPRVRFGSQVLGVDCGVA